MLYAVGIERARGEPGLVAVLSGRDVSNLRTCLENNVFVEAGNGQGSQHAGLRRRNGARGRRTVPPLDRCRVMAAVLYAARIKEGCHSLTNKRGAFGRREIHA